MPHSPDSTINERPPSSDVATGPELEIVDVSKSFDGVAALVNLSMRCPGGKVTALIGPNGAGKTTTLNVISRLIEPDHGQVRFDGMDLLAVAAHRVARVGISRTFQNVALWPDLPVIANVMVGAHTSSDLGLLRHALRFGRGQEERRVRVLAMQALEEVGCAELAFAMPDDLPLATQKRVELARALASDPRLLLLDEPANGLPRGEVDSLGRLLLELQRRRNLTMVVIDHHMGLVMTLADHVVVAESGSDIAAGEPDQIRKDERVIGAYLGRGA